MYAKLNVHADEQVKLITMGGNPDARHQTQVMEPPLSERMKKKKN
jgi:hypothetical protein